MTEKQFEGLMLGFLFVWILAAVFSLAYCSRSLRDEKNHRGRGRQVSVNRVTDADTHFAFDVAAIKVTASFAL